MNSKAEDLIGYTLAVLTLLMGILLLLFAITGLKRISGDKEINLYTHDSTRYIVKEKLDYDNSLVSHFNPFDGKTTYQIEVQKYKTDNHGIQRWQYDKTIDYGTHEPDINK